MIIEIQSDDENLHIEKSHLNFKNEFDEISVIDLTSNPSNPNKLIKVNYNEIKNNEHNEIEYIEYSEIKDANYNEIDDIAYNNLEDTNYNEIDNIDE
ncbi:31703_t:CDS:2 [Gigaspora margarita]|uniref:31703_t:CDS:1 n=1 Tax=Gigaspora margarita TaxID=4874 RepID=A0ABN7VE50_GIGMA|nr:31703_t:CDS:2 [Gigaspora margarita]